MSTKVEKPSTFEPHTVQGPATVNTSAASSGTKISFAVKKGFVIPKNKLSGSLVPTFRGAKKGGTSDVMDEESNKQLQRKTKWAPDLTQDAAVKKVRALAYQTRVDQITEQLKSGFLDTEDNQEPLVAAQNLNLDLIQQITNEKSGLLELERREAIGEILKLNSSYKAPSDYKPLLKEAKVSIPTKEHPGYNFSSILFGPSSDTLKQLEKETGAKIRVFGTKANTRDKVEITSADANEGHGAYEELYVHISADTYEKVDGAVSLIELLIKQVLVNQASVSTPPASVSNEDVKTGDQTQVTVPPNTVPLVGVNPEFPPPPISGPAQTPVQAQFHPYSGPWFSTGPPQTPTNIPNNNTLFGSRPVPQRPFIPQGQFGPSQTNPQPSNTAFSPVSRQQGPAVFTNMPPHMSSSATSAPPPPPLQARTPNSYPGNAPNFTPIQQPPPFMNQNLHRPNLDNFTFQPQRPQNLQSQGVPRPMIQNMMPQNQPYRPIMQNPSPQAILEALLRPILNQTRSQFPPFNENSNFGPRNNFFQGPRGSRGPHEGQRNMGSHFPPRPGNSLHPQHNYPPTNRPNNFYSQNNVQIGSNISVSIRPNPRHGTQQVYDPFTPTAAVSNLPARGGNLGNMRKQEDDPEYENLMASVGLK